MGLSCTKVQGLKKEKLQGPKKKPAHLRVWRKLRKLGKKDKAVLSMDEASGDLAKGTENQSPGPKSTKSESELVKLAPEQNEAPKTDIKPVEDRERSGGQEPTGEDQEMGNPEKGLPVEDMKEDGGGQEPTGEVQEMGKAEQEPPVEDMEEDGGGQRLLVDDPYLPLTFFAEETVESVLELSYSLIYYLSFVYREILVFLSFYFYIL